MRTGKVKAIVSNLVIVSADETVMQNEICMIRLGQIFLKAEVIKVVGKDAYVQAFESTRGLKVGDEAIFQGHLLEADLGPGILTKKYDGLQNDLDKIETVFLTRGTYTDALDKDSEWDFTPITKIAETVRAGSWIGEVKEKISRIRSWFRSCSKANTP